MKGCNGLRRTLALKELGMSITECDVPSGSALSEDLIRNAYFRDSFRAPLTRPQLGIMDIYAAILGHPPLLLKLLLVIRNAIVRPLGLRASAAAEIMRGEFTRSATLSAAGRFSSSATMKSSLVPTTSIRIFGYRCFGNAGRGPPAWW
jgi:Protein of unknown function (DUF2867)